MPGLDVTSLDTGLNACLNLDERDEMKKWAALSVAIASFVGSAMAATFSEAVHPDIPNGLFVERYMDWKAGVRANEWPVPHALVRPDDAMRWEVAYGVRSATKGYRLVSTTVGGVESLLAGTP